MGELGTGGMSFFGGENEPEISGLIFERMKLNLSKKPSE